MIKMQTKLLDEFDYVRPHLSRVEAGVLRKVQRLGPSTWDAVLKRIGGAAEVEVLGCVMESLRLKDYVRDTNGTWQYVPYEEAKETWVSATYPRIFLGMDYEGDEIVGYVTGFVDTEAPPDLI